MRTGAPSAPKRFLLWDHDGVLVDTERWYFAALREAMAPLGVDFDQATYLEFMADGRMYWELALARGATLEDVARQRVVRNRLYQQYLSREPLEIPGVTEVLDLLASDHRMAVVTTSRREDFQLIHRSRDLLRKMEFVLTIEDYPEPKPHPAPYLAALARFGAQPEHAVVIEDSARGLKAARAAGIDCIVIRHPFTAAQDFTGAWRMVDSIREVPRVLAMADVRAGPTQG
jgi:HAD superfamily hydrolase (TIGR01509 family)